MQRCVTADAPHRSISYRRNIDLNVADHLDCPPSGRIDKTVGEAAINECTLACTPTRANRHARSGRNACVRVNRASLWEAGMVDSAGKSSCNCSLKLPQVKTQKATRAAGEPFSHNRSSGLGARQSAGRAVCIIGKRVRVSSSVCVHTPETEVENKLFFSRSVSHLNLLETYCISHWLNCDQYAMTWAAGPKAIEILLWVQRLRNFSL